MSSLKITLGITLTIAISGCAMPRVYNQVRLGEPLPAELGLAEVLPEKDDAKADSSRHQRVFFIEDWYAWYVPFTASLQHVTVLTDANDRVVARTHHNMMATNLLLSSKMSVYTTIEVIVPADLLADPEQATLGEFVSLPRFGFSGLGDDANLSLMWAGCGLTPLEALVVRMSQVTEYTESIPLAMVLKPGYHQKVMVTTGGFVTVTNLGNNRLRIHTSQSLLMDVFGWLNTPLTYFEGLNERPPHWERGDK